MTSDQEKQHTQAERREQLRELSRMADEDALEAPCEGCGLQPQECVCQRATGWLQGILEPVDATETQAERQEHDAWIDEIWGAQELERVQREADEVVDDH